MKRKSTILLFILTLILSLMFFVQCDAPEEDDPLAGCFIATAAYGSSSAEEIDILRQFRDESLCKNALGTWFIRNYYIFSPPIADFIADNKVLRTLVKEYLVNPTVKILELTESQWSD